MCIRHLLLAVVLFGGATESALAAADVSLESGWEAAVCKKVDANAILKGGASQCVIYDITKREGAFELTHHLPSSLAQSICSLF